MDLLRQPFPSRRSPVLGCNGVVATSQPLAAQAGLEMLRAGGSAVDAGIATAVALTVLEPTSNGIGSDAFAIVWDGTALHGLNASGRWPGGWSASALREQGHRTFPQKGWAAVTVPGAPAGWQDLHERFGRLPLEQVLAPAIRYAEDGFPLSPVVAHLWAVAAPVFLDHPDPALAGWRETFTRNGRIPQAGERVRSPGHATCLRGLASRGLRDFYEGEIAERFVAYAAQTGGVLSRDDLAAHRNQWVEPISTRYHGHEIWEIPPNGQGIAALIALGLLEGIEAGSAPMGSAEQWHPQIEAMKLAFADAYRHVADPDHVPVPTRGLLDADYLASRRALIGERARLPEPGRPPAGGTVYLCTADRDGMMVSYIQSNYEGFGSGVVVPDLGLSLQNRGAGFVLDPEHPNVAAPGKRPRHTIIPAFLTRGGEALGPFGVMGAEMQPQGHLQVATSLIDHDLNPQAALDAPRWQLGEGLEVLVEPQVAAEVVQGLEARGHQVTRSSDSYKFGRGQIIRRTGEGVYVAGSEPRADGAAIAY